MPRPSLKRLNAATGREYTRWKQVEDDLKAAQHPPDDDDCPSPDCDGTCSCHTYFDSVECHEGCYAKEDAVEDHDQQEAEAAVEPTFTVEYRDGALIVDGPYDPTKFYRLAILSEHGNPIQDVNPEWTGGWPFEWSKRTLPDNPAPPAPPFTWQLQEENYISRRWRNRSQYPADYVSTTYKGEISGL